MNVKIIVFGTLFLIGNITLSALELNREGLNLSENNIKSFTRKSIRDELEESLVERGLDDDAAKDLAKDILSDNEAVESIKIHNFLTAVGTIEYEEFINQLTTDALFGKKVNFEDYDSLVRITYDICGKVLDKDILNKLSKVAMLNKNLDSIA
jgi:hypothetical protein